MTDKLPPDMLREMVCPYCGHRAVSSGIGAVYCGPHGSGSAARPAVQMREIDRSLLAAQEGK